MMLSHSDRFHLRLQRTIGLLSFPLLGCAVIVLLRFVMGYRIPNLYQVRRRVKELLQEESGPLLICANHLTLVDSAIIEWALASNWTYLRHFRLFPWSVPERRHYWKNVLLRLVCYFGKCVPVVRGGPPEQTKLILEKLRYLLKDGESLFIFPEGTRSRAGLVETKNHAYGVGRLLTEVEGVRVLCVYLRGHHQERFSSLPRRREVFYSDVELIAPRSAYKGLRAARDISTQIVEKLSEMEQKYFATIRPDWK